MEERRGAWQGMRPCQRADFIPRAVRNHCKALSRTGFRLAFVFKKATLVLTGWTGAAAVASELLGVGCSCPGERGDWRRWDPPGQEAFPGLYPALGIGAAQVPWLLHRSAFTIPSSWDPTK